MLDMIDGGKDYLGEFQVFKVQLSDTACRIGAM